MNAVVNANSANNNTNNNSNVNAINTKTLAMGTPQQRAAVAAAIARQHQQMIMQNVPAINADVNKVPNSASASADAEQTHTLSTGTVNEDKSKYITLILFYSSMLLMYICTQLYK
jgi:hypothetical protein